MRFKSNLFIQAVGVAAVAFLVFRSLYWVLDHLARLMSSLSGWLRYTALPWSEEVAIGLGLTYLLVAAVLSSRNSS